MASACALLGCTLAVTATPAAAQGQAGMVVLESVVVTAERREIAASDVPVSLTAISAKTLEGFAVENFADYGSLVPGMSGQLFEGEVQNRGPKTLGLRGVQTVNLTFFGGQNTVGFYINDTPIPVVNPRLVDVERVEVLRGPQGTLYGSSSLGGTVKLVTPAPNPEGVEGHVTLDSSYTAEGGYNGALEGSLNLPIGSDAALRGSAYYESLSGYIDFVEIDPLNTLTGNGKKDANQGKSYGGMLSLSWAPTESFSVTPSVIYSKRESDMADFFNEGEFVQVNHFLQGAEDEFTFTDLRLAWDLPSGTITSTTAYFDMSSMADRDVTDFLGPFAAPEPTLIPFDTAITQQELTNETRFVSDFEGPWQLIAGLFYTDREEVSSSATIAEDVESLFGLPVVNGDILSQVAVRKREEFALFGQAGYAVSDKWTLTGGLRWFDQKFDAKDTASGVFAGPSPLVSSGNESDFRYMGRAEFRPNDDSMYYLTVASGFRMGGGNFPLPSPLCDQAVEDFFGDAEAPATYKPDSLVSYELGGKKVFRDHRAAVSAAVFMIDWSDTQIPVVLGGSCPISGLSANAGSVESWGFELELSVEPIDNWLLWLGVSNINAEVSQGLGFPGATVTVADKGDPMPDIPEWTVSLTSDYSWPVSGGWSAFVRADYRYSSRQPVDFAASSYRQDVNLANLRVGMSDDQWEVALFANNVFDQAPSLGPFTFGSTAGGGFRPSDYTIRPRTLGVRVARNF